MRFSSCELPYVSNMRGADSSQLHRYNSPNYMSRILQGRCWLGFLSEGAAPPDENYSKAAAVASFQLLQPLLEKSPRRFLIRFPPNNQRTRQQFIQLFMAKRIKLSDHQVFCPATIKRSGVTKCSACPLIQGPRVLYTFIHMEIMKTCPPHPGARSSDQQEHPVWVPNTLGTQLHGTANMNPVVWFWPPPLQDGCLLYTSPSPRDA